MIGSAAVDVDADRRELIAVHNAVRSQFGVVAVVLVVAGIAWWSTVSRMSGMDMGPGTSLGTFSWFIGVWAVMMAAMMLPSFAPTAAAYAALSCRRKASSWPLFVGGYLIAWSAAGVVAYGLIELGRTLFSGDLTWSGDGRWLSGGVLVLAAVYQLVPFKGSCLEKCRSPLRALVDGWNEGHQGALMMGARSGGWCLGCSWVLMTALFALGVMSVTWMALVAALVALEKVGPAPRAARVVTAVALVVLAFGVLFFAHDVPGLVVPGSPSAMHMVKTMRQPDLAPQLDLLTTMDRTKAVASDHRAFPGLLRAAHDEVPVHGSSGATSR